MTIEKMGKDIGRKKWILWIWMLALLFLSIGSGCNTITYLQEGQYLIKKDPKFEGNKYVSSDDLYYATKTKANRRMLFGPKTFLYVYNTGMYLEKDSSFVKKLLLKRPSIQQYYYPLLLKILKEDIGEAPTLLDSAQLKADSANIHNLYVSKGFFSPQITYKVRPTSKIFQTYKVNISFEIKENAPFEIREVRFQIKDSTIRQLFNAEKNSCLLKVGELYNHDNMAAERNRIAQRMRNEGFFNFSPEMVAFVIDTTDAAKTKIPASTKNKRERLLLNITLKIDAAPIQYRIREVKDSIVSAYADIESLYADFRTDNITRAERDFLEIPDNKLTDSTLHVRFRVERTLLQDINFDFIARKIKLKEGDLYSRSKAVETQRGLQALTMFQYVTITYSPIDSLQVVDVKITNKLSPRLQAKAGVEVFTNVANELATYGSSFNISMGLNGTLRDRNLFSHSEQAELTMGGLIGFYRVTTGADSGAFRPLYEVRGKTSVDFPRLITPFNRLNQRDLAMFVPQTSVSASFRVENRQEYGRITVGSNFSYRWRHIPFSNIESSQLTPLALDVIVVPFISNDFQSIIDKSAQLTRDFRPYFSSRIIYAYTHTDYMTTRQRPTHFLRVIGEEGGTLPFLMDRIANIGQNDSLWKDHTLFEKRNPVSYGRFFKSTIEGKLYIPLWKTGEIVMRGFAGAALKVGSTEEIPIQNRFYLGGTNGMRAWRTNALGPGTTADSTKSVLPPGGEFAFEANMELRFKVWSYLNLGIFSDVGNVWFQQNDHVIQNYGMESVLIKPKGTENRTENMRLGWDIGVGARLDFSFLIFRLDVAQQMYIPQYRNFIWALPTNTTTTDMLNVNFGIGYPF